MALSLWESMTQVDFNTRCTKIINVRPRADGCLDLNFTCCDINYVATLQTQEKFTVREGYYYIRFREEIKRCGYAILSPEEFEEEYVVPGESDYDH